jgi:hypothetical protein
VKIIAGSIISGIGLLTEMLSEWLHLFFYAAFKIAEGTLAAGSSGYIINPPYNNPENVQIFLGTRIIIWLFIIFGVFLIVWGLREGKR